MSTEYSEREAEPAEADRGKVLDALADGAYWAFLMTTIEADGNLSLRLEMDDRIGTDELKIILQKTLAGLP